MRLHISQRRKLPPSTSSGTEDQQDCCAYHTMAPSCSSSSATPMWGCGAGERFEEVWLEAGDHDLEVQMRSSGGNQILQLSYYGPDTDHVRIPIPQLALFHAGVARPAPENGAKSTPLSTKANKCMQGKTAKASSLPKWPKPAQHKAAQKSLAACNKKTSDRSSPQCPRPRLARFVQLNLT